jgi:hypothetical protein
MTRLPPEYLLKFEKEGDEMISFHSILLPKLGSLNCIKAGITHP